LQVTRGRSDRPRSGSTMPGRPKGSATGCGRRPGCREVRSLRPRPKQGAALPKPLVIVESPAKAKTIAGYLGSDYTVKASVGHIRDLPRSKDEVPDAKKETHGRLAGIDPDDHFDACYVVPANKKKVVTELKQALKGADTLILATDEDREGEAIGWHVLEVLGPRVPVKRMVFHEITQSAIR